MAALVRDTGMKPATARMYVIPIVRHLQSEYGGSRIYMPKPGSAFMVDEVRAAFQRTNDARAVCKQFQISKATLYRMVGKPKKQAA